MKEFHAIIIDFFSTMRSIFSVTNEKSIFAVLIIKEKIFRIWFKYSHFFSTGKGKYSNHFFCFLLVLLYWKNFYTFEKLSKFNPWAWNIEVTLREIYFKNLFSPLQLPKPALKTIESKHTFVNFLPFYT